MTKMKRKRVSVLALVLVLVMVSGAAAPSLTAFAVSPLFARSEEEWARLQDNTLEYEEVADLIHEYNPTVLNNEWDYNDKKEDPSLDDIAQEYRDAANDLRDQITGEEGSELSDAMVEAQAKQLEQYADDNLADLEVYRLVYEQTEKSLTMAAQNSLASYQQSLRNLTSLKVNEMILESRYEVIEAKRQVGSASDMEVLSVKNSLLTQQAAITEAESSIKNLKQNLCVMLGWQYNAEPEICEIPAADRTRIQNMNPEADLEQALSSNYTLKINQRKLDNADAEYTKKTLETTIADNKQKIASSLRSNYLAVLQAEIAYEEALADALLENRNLETAAAQYNAGSLSEREYASQQGVTMCKQMALENADIQLFMAMETYDWAVNGMASAE